MFNSHFLVFFLFHCPHQHKNWHEWHLESITRERLIMCIDMRWIVLFSSLLLSKCLILEFGNISIQNRNWSEMKAKCARALIRSLKAKESERENSNELCKTKLYYATCRQPVCGQNKDYLCLQAARTLRAKRTLIWRSCAFNRGPMTMPVLDGPMTMPVLDGPMTMPVLDGPMTMPVLDGPMTMPVLDGVKPVTLPVCGTSVPD